MDEMTKRKLAPSYAEAYENYNHFDYNPDGQNESLPLALLNEFASFLEVNAASDYADTESSNSLFSFFEVDPGSPDTLGVGYEWNQSPGEHPEGLMGALTFSYQRADGLNEMLFFGLYDTPAGKEVSAKSFVYDATELTFSEAPESDTELSSASYHDVSAGDLEAAMGYAETASEMAGAGPEGGPAGGFEGGGGAEGGGGGAGGGEGGGSGGE